MKSPNFSERKVGFFKACEICAGLGFYIGQCKCGSFPLRIPVQPGGFPENLKFFVERFFSFPDFINSHVPDCFIQAGSVPF